MDEYHEEWKEKYNRGRQMDILKGEDDRIKHGMKYEEEALSKAEISSIVKSINEEIKAHNAKVLHDTAQSNIEKTKALNSDMKVLKEEGEGKKSKSLSKQR